MGPTRTTETGNCPEKAGAGQNGQKPEPQTPRKRIKGVVIGAPASGSGKTTFTAGLLAALRKRGMRAAPFKVGPDFIDPGHHGRITGRISRNLDGWMLKEDDNREIFHRSARDADIAVVEGVMGLFDGYDGKSDAGSTAQMAKWLGLPVVLVVDAKSMARSFAAIVRGFSVFDPMCRILGVVANNVAGPGHLRYLEEAMTGEAVPLLGGITRNSGLEIPSRHLGLYTTEDHALDETMIDALAAAVENGINLDALLERLPEVPVRAPDKGGESPGTDVRIGVARDNAFCFYYQDNLDLLRENGCEIVYFSPLSDGAPPPGVHGLYLGGGYPELFAGSLAANASMRAHIRRMCEAGMPVYAECGGFMYLCRRLVTTQGEKHDMTGVFPFETCMRDKLVSLGYREITFSGETPVAPADTTARGHEYHYSDLSACADSGHVRQVYRTRDKNDTDRTCPGWLAHQTLGSYAHLHFRSFPGIGAHFARACRQFKKAANGNVL